MPRTTFHPLTTERWPDLELLFGQNGACGGCWCMYWRLAQRDFVAGKGQGNRDGFAALIEGGTAPGILAYVGDDPAGWCAIEPRENYVRLTRSRTLAPVDDQPVWSITCFFVKRQFRHCGLSVKLIRAAVAHARRCGARIVEGYPVETSSKNAPAPFIWTGTAAAFRRAGFREAARRARTRPIMRKTVRGAQRG
ncbi:MAG: GNAT family N-acetyltransferase [Phycisphaerae bacterium]